MTGHLACEGAVRGGGGGGGGGSTVCGGRGRVGRHPEAIGGNPIELMELGKCRN